MKKVIIIIGIKLNKNEMASLEAKFRKDYQDGFLFLPYYCQATVIDTDVEPDFFIPENREVEKDE